MKAVDKLDTFGPVRLKQLSARHVNKIATRAMLHVSHTSPQDMRRLSLSVHNIISHVLRVFQCLAWLYAVPWQLV